MCVRMTDRRTLDVQLHLLLLHHVSLPPTPDLLNPNLKDTVICAMKITQEPQGLGSW